MPRNITVLGSLNADCTKYLERLPRAGESVTAVSARNGFGGKGANQALAALRLSRQGPGRRGDIDVSMIGRVGNDQIGRDMRTALEMDGVDVEGVKVSEDYSTGQADIMIEISTGESRVCLIKGANHSLRPEDFRALDSLSGRSGVKPELLVLQLEIPRDVVEQILMTAHENDIPVLLNPAPAAYLLTPSWNAVTHLIANETEAAMLSGQNLETIRAQGYTSGWKAVTDDFLRLGVKHVAITLGANGVVYSERLGEGIHVEAERVSRVVDATTAGDTFVGAYAATVVQQGPENWNMAIAIRRSLKAAAYVVQRAGTQATIPWAGQLADRRASVYGPV